mgnify:CR=1 FL=1
MSDGLFKLILSIIPVLGAILTYFVIPYFKSKVSNTNLDRIKKWVDYAVKCAELMYVGESQGQFKKEYVVEFLNAMINKEKIYISEEQLNVLIEAAVLEIKAAGQESKNLIPADDLDLEIDEDFK